MSFDRVAQDVGNIVAFEHVNVRVPDLELARTFYVHALGCTFDPFIDHGPNLLWFNLGYQQFHVPKGEQADVVRGIIEIRVPSLAGLERRLGDTAGFLTGSKFSFAAVGDGFDVVGPWGNRFRCTEERPPGEPTRGIPSLTFATPMGTSAAIARFYKGVFGAPVTVSEVSCEVSVGSWQLLRFVETADEIPAYDAHHLAVYVADFSGPYRWLVEHGLLEEESSPHQYRFNWITDPETGQRLFEIEHEVRSLRHPLYQRPLVNRNLEQRILGYIPGADERT